MTNTPNTPDPKHDAAFDPDKDPDKFVTVGKFLEPVNAQMAKGMLESASIECFLQGENANSLLALAFRARLLVHKHDEETAREILGEAVGELTGDELTPAEQHELEAGDDD
ncbi:DUF2007 domain-containing protein [Tunturiibacter empetritectus]|uniref:DUF2007 domain-containing protein n=1 Tax=Tunturiibacter lichenicola TaxID=2051959 RepID=A0A852VGX3_9BACT|nr:DUF2007 domain-containing protein [Edaphobacter lichenicola]NYF90887.1 hypothetical protein [Edaphobacter lichenicola]